jgi:hypothetical protein
LSCKNLVKESEVKLEMIDKDVVVADPRPLRLVVRRSGRRPIGNWANPGRLIQNAIASWRRISGFRR